MADGYRVRPQGDTSVNLYGQAQG